MDPYGIIPNKAIRDEGPISKAFLRKGVNQFHDACEYVQKLSYGRTSGKSNWLLVLTEGRGTCSTKHALIASLAIELNIDVHLMLGIYPMKESNTPGVGKILNNSGYDFLPEAHCYLKYNDTIVDITGLPNQANEPINEFIVEEQIIPEQTGKYKEDFHQNYIKQWKGESKFDEVWALREACIKALST